MTDREQRAIFVCVNAMRRGAKNASSIHIALLNAGFTGPEARAAVSEVMKRNTAMEGRDDV